MEVSFENIGLAPQRSLTVKTVNGAAKRCQPGFRGFLRSIVSSKTCEEISGGCQHVPKLDALGRNACGSCFEAADFRAKSIKHCTKIWSERLPGGGDALHGVGQERDGFHGDCLLARVAWPLALDLLDE